MAPRLAPALVTFRAQLNDRFPDRSKVSDGWIGDAAHAARGDAEVSQHNPNDDDVVCALDITEDLAHGVDCDRLMQELDDANDPRMFYAIHDGEIENSDDSRARYTGANPHPRHLHLSVRWNRRDLYNDPRPWALPMLLPPPRPAPAPQEDTMYALCKQPDGEITYGIYSGGVLIGIAGEEIADANRAISIGAHYQWVTPGTWALMDRRGQQLVGDAPRRVASTA